MPWMCPRALAGACLLATLALAACGEGAAPPPSVATDMQPTLTASPAASPGAVGPGDTLFVALDTATPLRSDTVRVELYDGRGNVAGKASLASGDGLRWSGALQVPGDAPAGTYGVEVVLNDGVFTDGSTVRQTTYRHDADASLQHYVQTHNRIEVRGSTYHIHLLATGLSPMPSTTVHVQAP